MLPVVTGFNGATADGRPTTLGRGGSDFSASILAAALDASELWIWTDVDGIMSADPRLVPDAEVLTKSPTPKPPNWPTTAPRCCIRARSRRWSRSKIPVWSKNSFAPGKARHAKSCPPSREATGARAVASMANVALVSIEPASPELSGVQVMARALDALARANVEVLLVSSSSYRQNFCFLVRAAGTGADPPGAGIGAGAGVGPRLPAIPSRWIARSACWPPWAKACKANPALAGRIFTAISREQVNIIAIAQGSSELTIAVVVSRDGLEKAVRAVHAECGMGASHRQVSET